MSKFARRVPLGLFLICFTSASFAAGPAIGLAVVNGSFQLDHSNVWGNATLFDGNVIETNRTSSQLQLNNGVNMQLAAQSRARVYESRLVLEKGIGQLESANYRIEADHLQVMADEPGATARVQVAGPNRVIVAAREGSVRVSNSDGVLIARLDTGREMTFEPQAESAAAVTKVSGILALKDGKFILVDRVTNVTMQLQGAGLEHEVGNLVEITGTVDAAGPTVAGASQLIDVTKTKRLVKGAASAAGAGAATGAGAAAGAGAGGAGAGAAGGAAAGAAAGLSTGAIVAIVGGVAAAGTLGGLAVSARPSRTGQQPTGHQPIRRNTHRLLREDWLVSRRPHRVRLVVYVEKRREPLADSRGSETRRGLEGGYSGAFIQQTVGGIFN